MDPYFFSPHPALKELVNNIMISRVDFDNSKPRPVFPFPPFPEQSLFFYPCDKICAERSDKKEEADAPPCIIGGPRSDRLNIRFGYHHLVIKVSFQPGGLYRLLALPMQKFLGVKGIDARDVLGNELNIILERLREAGSFYEMKTIVDQYLLSKANRLKQHLPIDHVMIYLLKGGGLISIDDLASSACLSNRQFDRVFKERIGLSPKFFSRVVRFARAWVIKETQPDISWIKIAHECGYYDQMHLIRDFKELAGSNPSQIEAELLEAPMSLKNGVFL
jgi:AraC-like DNA-binding protein